MKQYSKKTSIKQRRDIDRKVIQATQEAFDINVESIFNEISKEKLSIVPLSPCLSCQLGITQHINHKDLLKVENLSKYLY